MIYDYVFVKMEMVHYSNKIYIDPNVSFDILKKKKKMTIYIRYEISSQFLFAF